MQVRCVFVVGVVLLAYFEAENNIGDKEEQANGGVAQHVGIPELLDVIQLEKSEL